MQFADDGTADSSSDAGGDPDAHGHAALLLTESLIHMLVDRKRLTTADAIEVIETAIDVKMQAGATVDEAALGVRESLHLLSKMSASFKTDLQRADVHGVSSQTTRRVDPPGT